MSSFYTGTGFSIEIKNFRLESRGEYQGLPLYEVIGGQVGNFSLIAPSSPLLSAPIQICMNPLFTLYFNEILLGATFTGQVGAVKAQFPLNTNTSFLQIFGATL